MILIVDNYDSFTYNLVHLVARYDRGVCVRRNDAVDPARIRKRGFDRVVLSPGPGRPDRAGACEDIVRELSGTLPILGVCLGHQAICEAFGARIVPARSLVHGKSSRVDLDRGCPLFADLPESIEAGRYHSLSVDEASLPEELRVVARAEDGEVMAVAHEELPVFGLQFHPESIMTPAGGAIMRAFLRLKPGQAAARPRGLRPGPVPGPCRDAASEAARSEEGRAGVARAQE